MFSNTRIHDEKITGYQYSIRTGNQIPENAVNLAYYYNKPLTPSENIFISDMSKFIIENVNQAYNNETLMYPDNSDILVDKSGSNSLDSELFDITDKFKDGVPLYYCYKLSHKCFTLEGIDDLGYYKGSTIVLLTVNKKPLRNKNYKYSIILKPTSEPSMYDVYIYTSFILENNKKMYCSYNAVVDKDTGHDIIADYIESINPQPYFMENTHYIIQPITTETNKLYINDVHRIIDNRVKLKCKYIVSTDNGYLSAPMDAEVVRKDYAFPHEIVNYNNNLQIVSTKTAKEIILDNNLGLDESLLQNVNYIVDFDDTDSNTAANKFKITLTTDPNGESKIYATTFYDTGALEDGVPTKTIDVPDTYHFDANNTITPMYGVKKKDHRQIQVISPIEIDVLENWYPRIQSGRFTKSTISDTGQQLKLYYRIPEYDKQIYSSIYDKPYVDIVDEVPVIINSNTVKTKYSPLYVRFSTSMAIENLKIRRINAFGDIEEMNIASWNSQDGTIQLLNNINDNDKLFVDYTYEEQCFVYRGFFNNDYGEFFNLDLNPNQYHTVKVIKNESAVDVQVYSLFNKIIHIYMRPLEIINVIGDTETVLTTNEKVIYHTFDNTPESVNDLLLGKIYLKHNTTLENAELVDTRTRGGGIVEDMYEPLRRVLEPQSNYFLDVGYWDGEPYSENAVDIIRLDRKILKEYGGNFTVQEVEKAVHRWIALGVLPIIEYVTTYGKDDSPNNTLVVQKTHKNRLDFTPILTLDTYNNMKVGEVMLGYYTYKYMPCGIINITDKNKTEVIVEAVSEVPSAEMILQVDEKLFKDRSQIIGMANTYNQLSVNDLDNILTIHGEEQPSAILSIIET